MKYMWPWLGLAALIQAPAVCPPVSRASLVSTRLNSLPALDESHTNCMAPCTKLSPASAGPLFAQSGFKAQAN
jgi:hypothetical protein